MQQITITADAGDIALVLALARTARQMLDDEDEDAQQYIQAYLKILQQVQKLITHSEGTA